MKKYFFGFLIAALLAAGGVRTLAALWNTGGNGSPIVSYTNITDTTAMFGGTYSFDSLYINYQFKLIGPLTANGPIVTTTLGSNYFSYTYTPDPFYSVSNPNYPANYTTTPGQAIYNATGLVPDTNYVVFACGYYNTQGAVDEASCGNPVEFKTKTTGTNSTGTGVNVSGTTLSHSPAVVASPHPVLSWSLVTNATAYTVQISARQDFSVIAYENKDIVGNTFRVTDDSLATNTVYYWRVYASNRYGTSAPSPTFTFQTGATSARTPTFPGQSTGASGSFLDMPMNSRTQENIFSMLYATGARWIDANGRTVTPKSVTARVDYFDENNDRLVPSDDASHTLLDLFHTISVGNIEPSGPAEVAGCVNGSHYGPLICCNGNWNLNCGTSAQ